MKNAGQQKSVLISTVGPEVYDIMKNSLEVQEKPSQKTFEELVALVKNARCLTPPWQSERLKFLNRNRDVSRKASDGSPNPETVMEYVTELRKLAATCRFSQGEYKDRLRDRLLHGVGSESMQMEMIKVGDEMTFDTALAAALRVEAAGDSLKVISQKEVGATISQDTANRLSYRNDKTKERCWRCGGRHDPSECKFKETTCYRCKQKGHIRSKCRSVGEKHGESSEKHGKHRKRPGRSRGAQKQHQVSSDDSQTDDEANFGIYNVGEEAHTVRVEPYTVTLAVGDEGKHVTMGIDTGASRSTISESVYNEQLSDFKLQNTNVILKSYTNEVVPVLGAIKIPVKCKHKEVELSAIVVAGNKPCLLGRDWLKNLRLDWERVFAMHRVQSETPTCVAKIVDKYKAVFKPDNQGIRDLRASIKVKENAKPVFQKSRPVPYALVEKVEQEYDRLIESDVMYPVEFSEWATPVVNVAKANGKIRVCGDYKAVNEVIEDDSYKFPNVQDLFAKLAQDGLQPKVFTVLDLSGAFNQLLLDEEAAKLLVLNTHKGLLATKRLTYGVKVAPAQFQACIDKVLGGVKHVFTYIDDILIATASEQEHVKVLEEVFKRLEKYNVKLNGTKCQYMQQSIKYLGHELSAAGIKPLESKIEAIQKAPKPRDVSELKSFLGMVNFYAKFVENLSTHLSPLYKLLGHTTDWEWNQSCDEAFKYAKEAIASAQVLVHYDPTLPLILSVDASPYGIGAVLSHRTVDGEKPIAFSSRTLSAAEKNYAQIEKEGLAIIFGVKKIPPVPLRPFREIHSGHRSPTADKNFWSQNGNSNHGC